MEEKPKYETESDDTPKKSAAPPSKLTIVFAGPGSAQIIDIQQEGVVTTEQRASMALFFLSTCMQDWAIPLLQQIVVKTVEEVMKPKIQAARGNLNIPPGMLKPS